MMVASACIKISVVFGLSTYFNWSEMASGFTPYNSTNFESSKFTYYHGMVFHFISPDKLLLNDSPYTYCDLDPINKIDTDGNNAFYLLPSEFELELGQIPRFFKGPADLRLKYWQKHYVSVKNRQITYFSEELDDNNIFTRQQISSTKLARKIRAVGETLKRNHHLIIPEYDEQLTQLKNRFLHARKWGFNHSGNISFGQYFLEDYPIDKPFLDELLHISIKKTLIVPSHTVSTIASSSTGAVASNVNHDVNTSSTDAIPGTSTQSEFTPIRNRSINLPQASMSTHSVTNNYPPGFNPTRQNSSSLQEPGFYSNPTLDQVRNMPDPLEESGFYSTPSLDQVLKIPMP